MGSPVWGRGRALARTCHAQRRLKGEKVAWALERVFPFQTHENKKLNFFILLPLD